MNTAKQEFISGTKGAFKKHIHKKFDLNNIELFTDAVLQGYDDAKRTLSGIGKFWTNYDKSEFLMFAGKEIQESFKSPRDFDNIHNGICLNVCEWFKNRNFEIQYGQAQKIVNMAYKYLYCLSGSDQHEIYKSCHMPLDSFTLEWYKRYVWKKGNPKLTSAIKWSSMDQSTYCAVATAIKDYLSGRPHFCVKGTDIKLPACPLDAEFYVWPEMQMHMATEAFLFSIKDFEDKEKKVWKQNANTYDKFAEIQRIINEYMKD